MRLRLIEVFTCLSFFVLAGSECFAQADKVMDSLLRELKQTKSVVKKAEILVDISDVCNINDIERYAKASANLADSLNKLSSKYRNNRELQSVLSRAYNNMGYAYKQEGNYIKTLDYLYKSIEISERIHDSTSMADTYNNLGNVMQSQGDTVSAFSYYEKAYSLYKNTHDEEGIAAIDNNLGYYYQAIHDLKKALYYYEEGLMYRKKFKDQFYVAFELNNIGTVYEHMGDLQKGLTYYKKGLAMFEEMKAEHEIAWSYYLVGTTMLRLGQKPEGEKLLLKAWEINQHTNNPSQERDICKALYNYYKKNGNNQKALVMYEKYIELRDQLFNMEIKNDAVRKKLEHDYLQQKLADSLRYQQAETIKNAKINEQSAQLEKQSIQRWALFGGVGVLLIFSAVMINRFRSSQ